MNIAKNMEVIFVVAAFVLCAANYPSNETVHHSTSITANQQVGQVNHPG